MKPIQQYIVVFLWIILPFSAYNQEFGVQVGTQFSMNLNQFQNAEKKPRLGWHLGMYYSTLHPVENLQVEFQAIKESIKVEEVFNLDLYYTRLAFLYKRKITSKWHFLAGVQFGLFMGGDFHWEEKIADSYSIHQTIISSYKLDLGLPFGFILDLDRVKLALKTHLALINREDNYQNASFGVSLYYTGYR
ncbi:MAG: hypothetical protein AAF985_01385 [Bacteroidota bacterium]